MKNQYNEMFQDGIPGKKFPKRENESEENFQNGDELSQKFFSLAKNTYNNMLVEDLEEIF